MNVSQRVLAVILAVCFLSQACVQANAQEKKANWPQFRGATQQGLSNETGLPVTWTATKNIAWKADLPGPGASSPIVVGSRVFVTCYMGYGVPDQPRKYNQDSLLYRLVCLWSKDGSLLWAVDVEPSLPEQNRIREGHGYASSTPASDGKWVYAFFGKSGVYAFDQYGQRKWRTEVGSKTHEWGSATSPVLFKNLVIVNASVESESLVALDKKTGKVVWRTKGIIDSWNTPLLVKSEDGRKELVVAVRGKVLSFDPATGEQLWSCATDNGWYMVPSMVAHEGIIYCIGGRTGAGLAVRAGGEGDVTKTHRLWTINKGSNVSSPVLHDGHLYWMHENLGIACCAEAKTGKIIYEHRVGGADQVYASPVLADGKLYYLTRSGRTIVLAAKPEYELLAMNNLNDRSQFNGSPAIANGQLFIRSEKSLFCIGKK